MLNLDVRSFGYWWKNEDEEESLLTHLCNLMLLKLNKLITRASCIPEKLE